MPAPIGGSLLPSAAARRCGVPVSGFEALVLRSLSARLVRRFPAPWLPCHSVLPFNALCSTPRRERRFTVGTPFVPTLTASRAGRAGSSPETRRARRQARGLMRRGWSGTPPPGRCLNPALPPLWRHPGGFRRCWRSLTPFALSPPWRRLAAVAALSRARARRSCPVGRLVA